MIEQLGRVRGNIYIPEIITNEEDGTQQIVFIKSEPNDDSGDLVYPLTSLVYVPSVENGELKFELTSLDAITDNEIVMTQLDFKGDTGNAGAITIVPTGTSNFPNEATLTPNDEGTMFVTIDGRVAICHYENGNPQLINLEIDLDSYIKSKTYGQFDPEDIQNTTFSAEDIMSKLGDSHTAQCEIIYALDNEVTDADFTNWYPQEPTYPDDDDNEIQAYFSAVTTILNGN